MEGFQLNKMILAGYSLLVMRALQCLLVIKLEDVRLVAMHFKGQKNQEELVGKTFSKAGMTTNQSGQETVICATSKSLLPHTS